MNQIYPDLLEAIFICSIFLGYMSLSLWQPKEAANIRSAFRRLEHLMCVCLSPVHITLLFCSSFPLSKPSELSLPIQSSTKAKNKKSGQEKCDGSRIHFPSDAAAGLIPAQRVLWSAVNEPSSLKDSPFLIYSYTRTIHLRTICLLSLSAANSRPGCYI